MTNRARNCVCVLLAVIVTVLVCPAANAAVEVLGVQYQQDNPYPEYQCWYRYGDYPTTCHSTVVGCNAHVFLKNTGASPVTINDVNLGVYSLNTILKRDATLHDTASIYYKWASPPQDVFDMGEPVWYRADPNPIPAGGMARVVVRLRQVPVTAPISLAVATSAGTVNASIPVNASDPVLASIGFSVDRTKVYLHWRRSGGAAPTSVWLDGTDVTTLTTTVNDPAMNFAASVVQLAAPLDNMSYHVYQGVYADSKKAIGSLRTWVNRFLHGTWGVKDIADGDTAGAQAWIDSCQARGVNCYVNNSVGGLQDLMATAPGQAYAEAHDYGYVKDSSWGNNPRMWFIDDEPDLEEGNIACKTTGAGLRVPCNSIHFGGILGMVMLERGEVLRAKNPLVPTTINVDGNFKPDGWYDYGQLTDVMMMDSYYEQEQAGRDGTGGAALYTKPTSIYAAAIATTTAAEPNPMHMILYSCEFKDGNGKIWPFAAPANKRIQVYYALAGGAKGLAYWWFKSGYPYNGLNDWGPEAQALWNEIGRLGNEIKTAQPLLITGHPVSVPLTPSANVWTRALASGTDTMIVFAVNDQFYIDQTGTHLTPVANATVTVTLPTWMQPSPTAFEVSVGGLKAVNTQINGNQMQLNFGTLQVTKMIVLTMDPRLLSTLQQRYDVVCRPGICTFASESCTNIPLSIAQHPANLVLSPAGSGNFTVTAFGTGLKYQWQKDLSNLSDGGHYSGCTNSVLTVTGANAGDEASYQCVVFTTYGTNNSNPATLTLTTNPPAIPVANPATAAGTNSFTANWSSANGASGYRLDVSTSSGFGNFVIGYQDLDVGNTLSRSVSGLTVGTTYYYRVRAYNGNGPSGNSGTISVTLTAPIVCPPTGLVNASFEGGNTGGVAAGWTSYQRAPNPTNTIWSIQFASPPAGGGTNYQQIANSSSGGGGGVRQNITGCAIGATYTISGWMRGNSGTTSTCTVKVSPTASADWATATNLTPAQTYTGSSWTLFSGTVVATGTNMTLWLDGQTTGVGQFNAECFDAITIGCELTSSSPIITQPPVDQSVAAGGSASFTVLATGSGSLAYQWQKNSANLGNGGHYSGATTGTLTVTGADNNDVAAYRCVVTNAYGSVTSSPAALSLTTGAPPIPTANAATAVTNSSFTANWSSSSGAAGYRLDVSTNNAFGNYASGYQNLDVGNVLSRSVSGLNSSTTYYYRVRAYNGNGTSGNSSTITVTTTAVTSAPPPPVANPATSVTSTSFRANWNSADSATGYRLDVSTNNAFTNYLAGYQNLNAGALLSVNVTGLSVGKNYYYRVRASNVIDTSGNSATISVTTPPTLGYARQGSGLVFSWTTNATGYALEYATSLPATNWTPATPAPVVDGSHYVVTNTMLSQGELERYYRLRKP